MWPDYRSGGVAKTKIISKDLQSQFLCQQIYENITMSRDDVSAEAMRDCVEYQWFTMIEKWNEHMTGSQEVVGSIPTSSTIIMSW